MLAFPTRCNGSYPYIPSYKLQLQGRYVCMYDYIDYISPFGLGSITYVRT